MALGFLKKLGLGKREETIDDDEFDLSDFEGVDPDAPLGEGPDGGSAAEGDEGGTDELGDHFDIAGRPPDEDDTIEADDIDDFDGREAPPTGKAAGPVGSGDPPKRDGDDKLPLTEEERHAMELGEELIGDDERPEDLDLDVDEEEEGDDHNKTLMMIIGVGVVVVAGVIGAAAWWFFGSSPDDAPPIAAMEQPGKRSNVPTAGLLLPGSDGDAPGAKAPVDAEGKPATPQATLNQFAKEDEGPGTGVVTPAVTAAAFSGMPQFPPENPLPNAPLAGMFERSPNGGMLPVIAANGAQSWDIYSKPFDRELEGPKVSITVRGLGLNDAATEVAISRLPANVTLAFSPYGRKLQEWTQRARDSGHEVLIQLPMQSEAFPLQDAGPYALLTDLPPEQNLERLHFILTRFVGYAGVLTELGSAFASDPTQWGPILLELKNRGLFVLDAIEAENEKTVALAQDTAVVLVEVNQRLGADPAKAEVDRQLAEIERLAQEMPQVVLVDPYPSVMERVALWAKGALERGVLLAPATGIADQDRAAYRVTDPVTGANAPPPSALAPPTNQ